MAVELSELRDELLKASRELNDERDQNANDKVKVAVAEAEFDRIAVILATIEFVIDTRQELEMNAVAARLEESIQSQRAVGFSLARKRLERLAPRIRESGETEAQTETQPQPGDGSKPSNEDRRLSATGTKLIQAFESCHKALGGGKFRAYLDPVGVLTIGWGHTNHLGRRITPGSVWTQQECDEAFREDMQHFEDVVNRMVKVPINQNQFDALVSFCYNCGEGNLARSTLLRKVNSGDFDGAAKEFGRWVKARGVVLRGLVRRRTSESLMFRGLADVNFDGVADGGMSKAFEPPEPQAAGTLVPKEWMPDCQMKRIICHWTAGAYKASEHDRECYHILIEKDGRLVRGERSIDDNVSVGDDTYAAHTFRCNTQSIGIAVCCMANAVERPFEAGSAPMTQGQWDLLAQVAAELARRYRIPVKPQTILGHGEVQDILDIPQKQKWDPMVLPWDPSIPKRQVGDLFRAKVRALLE